MFYRLTAGAVSDVGTSRTTNQDAAFTSAWGAAVADGVGGGPSGDLASAALLHRFAAAGRERLAPDADSLHERIRLANWDLHNHVRRDPSLEGMSTTFTGLFVSGGGGELLLAHTGDSRAYLLREGELTRQTRDDSFVQVLVDHGLLSLEDAAHHPRRNIITASLGGGEGDFVAVREAPAADGDRWLLCSDGLTDYVSEETVATLLREISDPREAAAALAHAAIEAETLDNVTAVVCDVSESPAPPAPSEVVWAGSAAGRFAESFESA